jgi:type III secretory pathway component EscU
MKKRFKIIIFLLGAIFFFLKVFYVDTAVYMIALNVICGSVMVFLSFKTLWQGLKEIGDSIPGPEI